MSKQIYTLILNSSLSPFPAGAETFSRASESTSVVFFLEL